MIIKSFIYIGILSFSFGGFVNQETGWSFDQSTLQAFYIFSDIHIDGEVVVGDGSPAQDCDESYCCQNPYSCDVLGAFYNGVCVGWIYADSSGNTTVPANGNDGGEYSESYPQSGDSIYFRLYDVSEDRVLHFDSDSSVPDSVTCMNPSTGESEDCIWNNFGIYMCSNFMLDNEPLPDNYTLLSGYPNPFNPSLNIDFFMNSSGLASIEVYDMAGKLVESLASNEFKVSGNHSIAWNPENITSGEYIVRLSVNGSQVATQKVAYIK
jgi:hypothetical protein